MFLIHNCLWGFSERPRAAATRQHAAAADQSHRHSNAQTPGTLRNTCFLLLCHVFLRLIETACFCVRPVIRVLTVGSQVLASQCLTALCASAGGGDGCTVAEQSEIDVLLNALLSPCFSVRDAALRVSLLKDRQQHIVHDADQRVTLMSGR